MPWWGVVLLVLGGVALGVVIGGAWVLFYVGKGFRG